MLGSTADDRLQFRPTGGRSVGLVPRLHRQECSSIRLRLAPPLESVARSPVPADDSCVANSIAQSVASGRSEAILATRRDQPRAWAMSSRVATFHGGLPRTTVGADLADAPCGLPPADPIHRFGGEMGQRAAEDHPEHFRRDQ